MAQPVTGSKNIGTSVDLARVETFSTKNTTITDIAQEALAQHVKSTFETRDSWLHSIPCPVVTSANINWIQHRSAKILEIAKRLFPPKLSNPSREVMSSFHQLISSLLSSLSKTTSIIASDQEEAVSKTISQKENPSGYRLKWHSFSPDALHRSPIFQLPRYYFRSSGISIETVTAEVNASIKNFMQTSFPTLKLNNKFMACLLNESAPSLFQKLAMDQQPIIEEVTSLDHLQLILQKSKNDPHIGIVRINGFCIALFHRKMTPLVKDLFQATGAPTQDHIYKALVAFSTGIELKNLLQKMFPEGEKMGLAFTRLYQEPAVHDSIKLSSHLFNTWSKQFDSIQDHLLGAPKSLVNPITTLSSSDISVSSCEGKLAQQDIRGDGLGNIFDAAHRLLQEVAPTLQNIDAEYPGLGQCIAHSLNETLQRLSTQTPSLSRVDLINGLEEIFCEINAIMWLADFKEDFDQIESGIVEHMFSTSSTSTSPTSATASVSPTKVLRRPVFSMLSASGIHSFASALHSAISLSTSGQANFRFITDKLYYENEMVRQAFEDGAKDSSWSDFGDFDNPLQVNIPGFAKDIFSDQESEIEGVEQLIDSDENHTLEDSNLSTDQNADQNIEALEFDGPTEELCFNNQDQGAFNPFEEGATEDFSGQIGCDIQDLEQHKSDSLAQTLFPNSISSDDENSQRPQSPTSPFLVDQDLINDSNGPEEASSKQIPTIFIGEIHPNFDPQMAAQRYTASAITSHIQDILNGTPCTVIVDITTGGLQDKDVQAFIVDDRIQEAIRTGKLNVVLFRSAQKFDMLGFDNYNGGITSVFNNGEEGDGQETGKWKSFNAELQKHQITSGTSYQGLSFLQKCAMNNIVSHQEKIRHNTEIMYHRLKDNFFPLQPSDDPHKIFIHINVPQDEHHIQEQKFIEMVDNIMDNDTIVTERDSFGFFTTNISVPGLELTNKQIPIPVRLTVGVEPDYEVERIAFMLCLQYQLWKQSSDSNDIQTAKRVRKDDETPPQENIIATLAELLKQIKDPTKYDSFYEKLPTLNTIEAIEQFSRDITKTLVETEVL